MLSEFLHSHIGKDIFFFNAMFVENTISLNFKNIKIKMIESRIRKSVYLCSQNRTYVHRN